MQLLQLNPLSRILPYYPSYQLVVPCVVFKKNKQSFNDWLYSFYNMCLGLGFYPLSCFNNYLVVGLTDLLVLVLTGNLIPAKYAIWTTEKELT